MSDMSIDISRYTYRVTWSVEDDQFVATCPEFPSLSWLLVQAEFIALDVLHHEARFVLLIGS